MKRFQPPRLTPLAVILTTAFLSVGSSLSLSLIHI